MISAAVAVARWSFVGRDGHGGSSKDEEFERRSGFSAEEGQTKKKQSKCLANSSVWSGVASIFHNT